MAESTVGCAHVDANEGLNDNMRVGDLFCDCPEFFVKLQEELCSTKEGQVVAKKNRLTIIDNNKIYYIEGLPSAASKWRLAKYTSGIECGDGISSDLKKQYSAQIVVSMAVFAFDKVSAMHGGRKWFDHYSKVFSEPDNALCVRLRAIEIEEPFFDRLKRSVSAPPLRTRIDSFREGDDTELYAVCHGIRNAFAHGKIGGVSGLVTISDDLRCFILDGIESYYSSFLVTHSP